MGSPPRCSHLDCRRPDFHLGSKVILCLVSVAFLTSKKIELQEIQIRIKCKDSLLPVSGGYPQLPYLTQHPSGLQELHALLHHLVQVGQDGQYVGLHLCVRFHLERKQRWLSELEGESKIELGTSSEHLQKLGSFGIRQQFLMTISGWAPWTQDHRSCQPGQRFQSQCDSQDSRSYLDTVSHPGRKLG